MLLTGLGAADSAFLDASRQIESEWRALWEPEWFDAWLGDLYLNGGVYNILPHNCPVLAKGLFKLGFPVGSRDIWYIRTAHAVAVSYGAAYLITEDIDFHEPSKKKTSAKERSKILAQGSGGVAKHLAKRAAVNVRCVSTYISSVA